VSDTEQVGLSRNPTKRQVAEPDHDGRTPICPDCGDDIAASKGGGKPLAGLVPECFGWSCEKCNLTLPSNCHGPDAPGFNDKMAGLEVKFRDGSARYVPIPVRYVDTGIEQGDSDD
jgi:hypothetical protein